MAGRRVILILGEVYWLRSWPVDGFGVGIPVIMVGTAGSGLLESLRLCPNGVRSGILVASARQG